jgi:outer membrane protein assembly factor BamB
MEGRDQARDSVASMKEELPKLSAGQPKPSWQLGLKAQETDFISFLSNDRILVGTLETAGFFFSTGFRSKSGLGWGLKPGEVILLNPANGEKIWALSRTAFGYPQEILATDPLILIKGSTKCAAVNPENGSVVWQRDWKRTPLGGGALLLPSGDRLILFSERKSTVSLSALNVKDGSEIWRASLDNYPKEKQMVVYGKIAGDTLLLVGPEVAAFSVHSGQLLWRKPFPGVFGPAATASVLGDDLYFTDGPSITRTEPGSGNVIWRQDFPGNTVQNLSMQKASVFIDLREGGGDTSRDALQALDRQAGKPLWKRDLADQAQSGMTLQDGRIYLTTTGRLVAIDASNGEIVSKVDIPPSLQTGRVLPDILRVTQDRIYVARETGILAVDRRDGSLLYAEPVVHTAPFTSDYTLNKLNLALESVVPLKGREAYRAQNLASFSQVQRDAALAYQQLQGAASRSQHALANALRTYLGERQIGKEDESDLEASGEFTAALLAVPAQREAELRSGYKAGRTGIMTAEISQAFRSHADSLQKDLYVRPSYEPDKGWSLVVVDLKTGRRAEVLLSPPNDPLGLSAPNLPAFAVDLTGSRIVSKGLGLGLDPARFETYEKSSFTPRQGGGSRWFATGHAAFEWGENWSIPYPSILAFDLATLSFGQESDNRRPTPKPIPAEKKQLNDQLIHAAFQCDLAAVQKALDAGADVNAVNAYGQTALMLAAESVRQAYKRKDIIATLVERGADVSIRDAYGWTAGDHLAVAVSMLPYLYANAGTRQALKLLIKGQGSE